MGQSYQAVSVRCEIEVVLVLSVYLKKKKTQGWSINDLRIYTA